ncbi:DUF6366 family protein [Geosporobacter ferrireducens]|uniref:Phage capsid protein n=1 Tax=Geosporobacter ferrireducens TaxID=1424294 RepID=A0A1D8GMP5_9FIRM|nr:DUF6366 family protein [Geosporobacter ferrireducens]AOT72211.1 hypothetical protein Gferi_23300 [Geosporobacter ferrireducens]MTI56105.1 hypothetical protein [Geosporobacter ferrireducens]
MNKRDYQDKEEQRKIEEYKKKPMINFADSINRSKIGDLNNLTKQGWLSTIITIAIFIGIWFFLSR